MVTLPQLAPTRRIRWTSDFSFWKAPNYWREMEKSNFQAASDNFCLAGVNLQLVHPMIDADFPIFIGLNRNHGFRGRLYPTKACPPNNESHKKVALIGFTHLKLNIAPEKLPGPKRKVVFKPSFFRGYVNLRECKSWFPKNQPNHIHPNKNLNHKKKHHAGSFCSNQAYMSSSQRRKQFYRNEATVVAWSQKMPQGSAVVPNWKAVELLIHKSNEARDIAEGWSKDLTSIHSKLKLACDTSAEDKQLPERKTHAITFWEVPRVFSKKLEGFPPVWNHDRKGHRTNFHTPFFRRSYW